MPDVMQVDMPVSGAQETRKAFADSAVQAERLANATERIDRVMNRVSRGVIGPNTRLAAAQGELSKGRAYGASGDYIADLEYRVQRAQKAADRMKPASFQDRLGSFVSSSRFGMGNLSPLVGRAASLVGGEAGVAALSNPYVAAGLLILEGAKQVAEQLRKVADDTAAFGQSFAASRVAAGTDTAGAAALRSIGISGERARALLERLTTDPIAQSYAVRFGASAVPGPYGTLNAAPSTLNLVKGLRTLPEQEQMRALRNMGAEDLAPLLRIKKESFDKLMEDSKTTRGIANPDFERQTAEYTTAMERLKTATENLEVAFGKKLLPAVTDVFNKIADWQNYEARRTDNPRQFTMDTLYRMLNPIFGPMVGRGAEALAEKAAEKMSGKKMSDLDSATDGGSGATDVGEKLSSVSTSLDDLGDAASRLTKVFGESAKAGEALPKYLNGPGFRGDALLRARERGALRLGVVV